MMARDRETIEADLQQVQDAMMQTSAFGDPARWRSLLQRRQWLQIEMVQAEMPAHKQKDKIKFICLRTTTQNI